jgi:hypothetical protein
MIAAKLNATHASGLLSRSIDQNFFFTCRCVEKSAPFFKRLANRHAVNVRYIII